MAILPQNPREILLQSNPDYQRLAQEHSRYEAELERLSKNPYLSSEDLQEETRLKKLKLRVKDEMERFFSRYVQTPKST
ncbi:MAG TPA: YdcH family protein [Candidatus Acidoferrales bacterium]|nr:YdcH family protein [Candidatus Acidoferrales bacterium]